MSVVTNRQHVKIANLIRAGREFRNGGESFSGMAVPSNMIHHYGGWMSDDSASIMRAYASDQRYGGITYVIKSYSTPIAYRLGDGRWIVPTDHYSPTTQRHQAAVWAVLRQLGIDTHFEWVPDVSEKTGKPLKTRSHREQITFGTAALVSA